jgi:DNA-binding beta-propeller fold protein YncE
MLAVALSVALLAGVCVWPGHAHAELFVSNFGNSSVTVYSRTASGDVAPLRTLSGSATELSGPFGIGLDPDNVELFVANDAPRIVAFDAGASGAIPPLRMITGTLTGLGAANDGLVVDLLNDEIVVTNANASTVRVFARTDGGDIAPKRPPLSTLNPIGIAVDAVNDELLVVSTNLNVYARTATGSDAPQRTIVNPAAQLTWFGVAVDPVHDEIFVADRSSPNAIRVYARTASGTDLPLRTLTGASTLLNAPVGVALDLAHDELIVTNDSGNSITVYSRTAADDTAPLRIISGGNTGLARPLGVAVRDDPPATPTPTVTPTPTATPGPATADHFMAYAVAATKGTAQLVPLGPLTLADRFRSAGYDVAKLGALLAPADKNGEGRHDPATHLLEYRVKAAKGAGKLAKRSDVPVVNQCNDVLLQVTKPVSLLVPAATSLAGPVAQPDPLQHQRDHYLCYAAKTQKKRSDGTPLAPLPKRQQVVVEDQFQTRRYDLKKITKLCQPVDKSGSPVLLKGPQAGEPVALEPATIRHGDDYLVCYQAKPATKLVAQTGCAPTNATDKGSTIVPKPPKHTPVRGIHVATQLGTLQIDTRKERELCLPSTSP